MSARTRTESFAPDLVSVRDGRHFVRDTLESWGLDEVVDDAQLCVSEIITNAVCHAGTELTVAIRCDDDRGGELAVDVHDGSSSLAEGDGPVVEPAPLDAIHGRGLHIVASLSRTWGVRAEPGGKVVWFRLGLSPAADERTDAADNVVDIHSRRDRDGAAASSRRHPSHIGHVRATG